MLIGKFFLVDAGYAVRPGFLPPYRGTRYHLREYGVRRPQNARELFNLRHSALRVTVEHAFGALKNRFRILDNKPFHPYKTQVKLVLACCIIHNWILRHGLDDLVSSEADWQANPMAPMMQCWIMQLGLPKGTLGHNRCGRLGMVLPISLMLVH